MTSEHVLSAEAVHEPEAGNGCCGVVLHATRVGNHTLRTERELETGRYFYYVDNVLVSVNTYLKIVRENAAAHG